VSLRQLVLAVITAAALVAFVTAMAGLIGGRAAP
jgi:hypothetical protein